MLTESDEHYMEMALAEARIAGSAGEVPVGSIIVVGNAVVGRGHNRPVSTNDPTAHAEIVALREAATHIGNYRIPEATIYSTIEPCTMCAGAMIHARVARLVFGALDPKAGAAGSIYNVLTDPRMNHCVEVVFGIRHSECAGLLRDFFTERRRMME